MLLLNYALLTFLNVVKVPKDLKNKNFLDKFESMNFQESKNGDDR